MTMRLTDTDALLNTLQELFDKREKEQMFTGSRGACVTWNDAIYHIKSAPTIDAVPVVRCKDCKWWTKQEKSIQGRCALTGTYPTGGWYCGNGERKDDE